MRIGKKQNGTRKRSRSVECFALSSLSVVPAVEAVEHALHQIAVVGGEAFAVSQKNRRIVKELVGENVYSSDGVLQKCVLSEFLLANEDNKQALNNVVHPAVAADYETSGMEWLESAILFESGFDRRVHFDHIVCVTAPLNVRIQRIMQRDSISAERAAEWIYAQMPHEEVELRSDFVITNDGASDLQQQIDRMLQLFKLSE